MEAQVSGEGTPRSAPTLLTSRLRLRAHTAADLDASAAMWADDDVVRHIAGVPSSRQDTWNRLLRYAGLWAMCGFGYWLVETRDGAFLGEVGFGRFLRTDVPASETRFHAEPEAGWVLRTGAHGKGHAREAVRAVLGWIDQARPGSGTGCMIAVENAASIRLADAVGYRQSTQLRDPQGPVLLFRRPNPLS